MDTLKTLGSLFGEVLNMKIITRRRYLDQTLVLFWNSNKIF